jgi:hypothetical protein
LWVKETHALVPWTAGAELRGPDPYDGVRYKATWDRCNHVRWKSPLYMPRWASRITLRITEVRAQRVQEISEADAEAEGVESWDGMLDDADLCRRAKEMGAMSTDARVWYAAAWDAINGKRAPWASRPWVWAVTFARVS